MTFHSYHGCLENERDEGNLFVVDFEAEYEIKKAAKTDSLDYAIDSREIYETIKHEMSTSSNLLENVASRILNALVDKFDFISIKLSVAKKNPPVGGPCEWAKVTVEWE